MGFAKSESHTEEPSKNKNSYREITGNMAKHTGNMAKHTGNMAKHTAVQKYERLKENVAENI